MTSEPAQLGKKPRYRELEKRFQRVERQNLSLRTQYMSSGEQRFYPPMGKDKELVATRDEPFDDVAFLFELEMENQPYRNTLLFYRMMRGLYGVPDLLSGLLVSDDPEKPSVYDIPVSNWGYVLKIRDGLFAECRSTHANNRQRVKFWIDRDMLSDIDAYKTDLDDFYRLLIQSLRENQNLFEEATELKQAQSAHLALNVFAERYKSAKELLELAEKHDIRPPRRDLEFGESLELSTVGSIFLASALQSAVSVEALINTVYVFLLKDEFKGRDYERSTIKADVETRYLTAHALCEGFTKQILTPNTDLHARFIKLRDFRNTMVHGNLTEEGRVYAFAEENRLFFYGPTIDFRGRHATRKAEKKYPTVASGLDRDAVEEILQTVDELIQSLLDSCNADTRTWIEGWLSDPIVPPFDEPALSRPKVEDDR